MARDRRCWNIEWSDLFLWILSAIFMISGIVFALIALTDIELQYSLAFMGIGIGAAGIGVGLFGASIAQRSEGKMKALANLEFDEKSAMMQEYQAYFSRNFRKVKFERFRWDLEAMAHVAKWADKDKRLKISKTADKIATAVNDKVTEDDLEQIRRLILQIRG